ncbi:hypothetical protein N826_27970 [Skermanella aerolata KACC 11604]|nr:hypothetical protein N826_27970 [Skermanella aerolata KACC 11604]
MTDITRLEAIEEGGFLMRRFEDKPCPTCGALPGHQHKPHPLGAVEQQQVAAQAEIVKIKRDLTELELTLRNLRVELVGMQARSENFAAVAATHNREIDWLRPMEASTRASYRKVLQRLEDADRIIDISARRLDFLARRQAIEAIKVGRQRAEGLSIGIDGPTGHRFAQTVQRVLEAWQYPGLEAVTWEQPLYDFAVNGTPRGHNGKGVKAIFHSAFVVAVLIYCRENKLPHPGFVVLDSPLVTYRKPILYKRYGELDADEAVVAQTGLDLKFYEHLASLSDLGQFFVVENNDPPAAISGRARIETFSGKNGSGRQGLFPPQQ